MLSVGEFQVPQGSVPASERAKAVRPTQEVWFSSLYAWRWHPLAWGYIWEQQQDQPANSICINLFIVCSDNTFSITLSANVAFVNLNFAGAFRQHYTTMKHILRITEFGTTNDRFGNIPSPLYILWIRFWLMPWSCLCAHFSRKQGSWRVCVVGEHSPEILYSTL
jgi:hypothetical protein